MPASISVFRYAWFFVYAFIINYENMMINFILRRFVRIFGLVAKGFGMRSATPIEIIEIVSWCAIFRRRNISEMKWEFGGFTEGKK